MTKLLRVFGAVLFFLALAGCLSSDQRSSNLNADDAESTAAIEARLKNSAHVNEIISKLDEALRPVAGAMKEIEKVLKYGESELLKSRVAEIKKLSISMIREELDGLKRGLIDKKASGEWETTRQVNWPIERIGPAFQNGMSCDQSYVSLAGEPSGNSETVSLTLFDCMLPNPSTLVRATVDEKAGIDAELNLGDLNALLPNGAAKGNCGVKSAEGGGTEMECVPFTEKVGDLSFSFERLSYVGSLVGDQLDLALTISQVSGDGVKPLVRVTATKSPGQPLKVEPTRL
ncbi:MAG: hypothetical protein JST04_11675 [Bdellovibrionales bacterium]|nr:hypothetical protein [Bdellovibrionales bacterium]